MQFAYHVTCLKGGSSQPKAGELYLNEDISALPKAVQEQKVTAAATAALNEAVTAVSWTRLPSKDRS
jgi:hypothetical protein